MSSVNYSLKHKGVKLIPSEKGAKMRYYHYNSPYSAKVKDTQASAITHLAKQAAAKLPGRKKLRQNRLAQAALERLKETP